MLMSTSNQIKFIKQQRASRVLQVAKTFNRHKTNKRYMYYTLLITRDVALFIYLLNNNKGLEEPLTGC